MIKLKNKKINKIGLFHQLALLANVNGDTAIVDVQYIRNSAPFDRLKHNRIYIDDKVYVLTDDTTTVQWDDVLIYKLDKQYTRHKILSDLI